MVEGDAAILDETFWATLPDDSVRHFRVVALVDRHRGELTVVFSSVGSQRDQLHEMQRVRALLDERTADLEQLVYMASHDLRAPMRRVVQMLGAARRTGDPQRARQMLTHASDSARQAMRMHEDLVAFMRAHQDDVFTPRPLEVVGMAQDAWNQIGAPASFELDLSEARCVAHCSPLTLMSVLRCLMSNAVRHHHLGAGRVTVRAWEDDGVHLVVEDDGPGLTPEEMTMAVQLFGRLSPSVDGGSGLGLAVVSRAAHASGGMTWLRNRREGGLSVHVTLRGRRPGR